MTDTNRYLELLTGDPQGPTMWAWKSDRASGGMCVQVGTLDDMSSMLASKQAELCGIFNLVNRSNRPDRRQKCDITGIRAIWMDMDGVTEVPTLPLDPTMVVGTANGFHVYYVLDEVSHDVAWGEGMNRTLCRKYGGDAGAADVARVLRVPGFHHHKKEPYMVSLVEDIGKRYSAKSLEDALGCPTTSSRVEVATPPLACGADSHYGLRAASNEILELGRAQPGTRNRAINRACFKLGQLVAGGELSRDKAVEGAIKGAADCGYLAEHGERDTMAVVESGLRAGMRSPRGAGGGGPAEVVGVVCRQGGGVDRDGLADRLAAEIDRRIKMGFNPAPGPLRELNKRLGGGAPAGAVTLLGAPPGMGKSSLALDWAYGYAGSDKDKSALYCSLELTELDLYARLTTLERKLSWIDVRCGKHRQELLDTVQESLHKPFYAATRQTMKSVGDMRAMIDELSQKYGQPPLVIIDYLQMLLQPGETRELFSVMSDISGEVAVCAQESGSPIICITAVNRQSYNITDKTTGKPDQMMALSAAKNSGRLEYDAEAILGLQLFETEEGGGQYGWIVLAKNRSGGSSGCVGVRYDGLSGKFYDAEHSEVFESIDREKENRHSTKGAEVEEKIMEAVRLHRYRDMCDIFKAANVGRPTGQKAIAKLINERRLIKTVIGEYVLAAGETNQLGE